MSELKKNGIGKIISIPAETVILSEGTINPDMYKIIKGHVEVYIGYGTDSETLIGVLGPQSCFGEFGLLLKKPAIYTVIAFSDVLLMRITEGEIGDFVQQNHKNIIDIMRNMAATMMTMKLQIELLMNDLKSGKSPDDSVLRDIRKTMGNYAINRYVDMLGTDANSSYNELA